MRVFRPSQRCNCGLHSSEVWHCMPGWLISNFSRVEIPVKNWSDNLSKMRPVLKTPGFDYSVMQQNVPEERRLQFLSITNLTHFFQCIYLCPFFTCFEQPSAHYQENRIVSIHHLVCVTLCRWLPGMPVKKDQHTRHSPTHSDICQLMYWYNLILLMMSTGLLET